MPCLVAPVEGMLQVHSGARGVSIDLRRKVALRHRKFVMYVVNRRQAKRTILQDILANTI